MKKSKKDVDMLKEEVHEIIQKIWFGKIEDSLFSSEDGSFPL